MTYVPIVVPPTQPSPPSPRVRELAGLLTKVLEEYSKAHPSTTKAEVRAALRLAQATTGGPKAGVALAVTAGLLVAGVLFGLMANKGSEGLAISSSLPTIIMAVIFFLAIILVLVRMRSP